MGKSTRHLQAVPTNTTELLDKPEEVLKNRLNMTYFDDNKSEQFKKLSHMILESQFLKFSHQFTTTEELNAMDNGWEKYIDKLDREITEIKQNTIASEGRIANMIQSSEQHNRDMWTQTLEELRNRDNQRHTENSKLSDKIDKIDNTVKWGLGIIVAVFIAGITLIVATL